ncbi:MULTISPECIES: ATP-grasp domain-containing protein [unclassified Pseudarthrobacter]|uniref:ATP-grasp domain-containing protein n=1 Tax=unclassified Pseudarthrobacter TaxID=2647000 RepID=UPI003076C729
MPNTPTDAIAILEPFGNASGPLTEAVVQKNLRLITITQRDVLPKLDAQVVASSDEIFLVDFGSPTVVEDIHAQLNNKGVVGVITGWEFFTGLVAEVAAKLGLPGNLPEKSYAARNKCMMAQIFLQSNVRHAKTVAATDAGSLHTEISRADLAYPLVIKPAENAGSVGVSIIEGPDEIPVAVREAQAFPLEFPHGLPLDDRVVAQEYVGGLEYSVESVAFKGEISHVAVTGKSTTEGSRRAELGHVIPANVSTEDLREIHKAATAALTALGFNNGVAHTEVKVWNGEAWVIEAGLRPGGDHIIKLVPLATGLSLAEAYVDVARGVKPVLQVAESSRAAGVRFVVPDRTGTAVVTTPFPVHPSLVEGDYLVSNGESVQDGVDNISRLAYAIVASSTRDEFEQEMGSILDRIKIGIV